MICLTTFILFALSVGQGGAVSILTVENHNFHEHAGEDGWGEWSEWQPCSRTCGGGVTFMKRDCNRERPGTCDGPNKMYTSCSIQDCPVHAQDFRALQCSQYNNITYKGLSHEWIPYDGEAATNPCELFCQPKSGKFFLKMTDKVIDGTRCHPSKLDVCVDGTCEAVGCDMLLGSDLKMDVCGECGGDGSSCYLVKRSVTAKLPSGYVPLIFIPPGATKIRIWEKKASKNFLAVRDSRKQYVINGHWQINSSSVVHVAGSDLSYTKSSKRKKSQESIEVEGPTSEMLYIDVLVQDRNRGIEYEFYLPQGMRDLNFGENGWFTEQWQPCTAECGGGLQKRKVVCKNSDSGGRVLNYLCYTRERPESVRDCNTESCGARWLVGEWAPCSRRCRGGVQTRPVNCVQDRAENKRLLVLLSNEECSDVPRPESQRQCGAGPCPEWRTGDWSECSSSCGNGIQRRNVVCSFENECDATSSPPSERGCNLGPCTGTNWITTEWSECTGGCGSGVQTRQVACGTDDRIRYPETLCDASARPASFRLCNSELLCPDRPTWIAEEWSECSVTCGSGFQTRRVVCGLYEVESYRNLPDDDCSRRGRAPKPPTAVECSLQNCTASWYLGAWGPCSASCGHGFRSRVVLCVGKTDEVLDDEACGPVTRPMDLDICNKTDCENDVNELPHRVEPCHESTYGCCPDGTTKAQGDNSQGCPGVVTPSVKSVLKNRVEDSAGRCILERDGGNCRHWTVFWYHNIETGRCDRFWYGGCGGNGNRFRSAADCASTCGVFATQSSTQRTTTRSKDVVVPDTVRPTTTATSAIGTVTSVTQTANLFDVGAQPPQRPTLRLPPPLCLLRKSVGPCETPVQRWFFDGATGKCVAFSYGGCGGNENNFASAGNCVQICGDKKIPTFSNGAEGELPNNPPVPVVIKPGRTEVHAQVGEMVRLACMAEGSPKPTVSWLKVGQGARGEIDRGEILEDHSLLISKITSADQGVYGCTASNGYGPEQTWEVKLTVKDQLLIREAPSDTTVGIGEPAALRCRINEDVLFVTWYKDDAKVETSDFYVTKSWGDLHILQAERGDSGLYRCTANSTDASQSAYARLTVSQKEQSLAATPPSTRQQTTTAKQCRDYPKYANCSVVVLMRMCHKHDYALYCCASCGVEPSSPPRPARGRSSFRKRSTNR